MESNNVLHPTLGSLNSRCDERQDDPHSSFLTIDADESLHHAAIHIDALSVLEIPNSVRARRTLEEDLTILAALHILRARFQRRDVYDSPSSVMHFLRLQSQGLMHEVFGVMYLDTHHRLIDYEQLFRGTLNQASVYPREVTRQALAANAASVILHHNHPSGDCLPSKADEALTVTLRSALALVDIRVLDHVITSDSGAVSMRESGVGF